MKIGQYRQRQRCRHVELEQFWQTFASRGFVSDSWAFLLVSFHYAELWCIGYALQTNQQLRTLTTNLLGQLLDSSDFQLYGVVEPDAGARERRRYIQRTRRLGS